MNGQGGSYIIQPDGKPLQVEGQNMTDEQRAAAALKAQGIVNDAEAKAKAEAEAAEKAAAAAAEKASAETPVNQAATGKTGRRQQSEE
jgi:predicted DNA-binding transcriptional regulator YafY